ncbi:MAG: putative transcriptional regulator, MarR family [Rhodoglobus sp.]|jgi:DNA-binding MarR family transcriptional regulator|nr:putative transcriptional regulator, MarR family [Rhodoglobus sp.]
MTKTTRDDVVEEWRDQQRAYHATASVLDRALEQEFDLGLSEFEILDLVWESNTDECTMRDLVDLTPMTQSALSRVVDRLTRAGLIGRNECSYDRRSMFVSLTPEGVSVHARAKKVYRKLLADELG